MKNIAFIPIYKSLEQNNIFDSINSRDGVYEPFVTLKLFFEDHGLSLNTIDINEIESYDVFLFYRLDIKLIIKLFFKGELKSSIYLPLEPEIVDFFHSKKNLKLISKIFGRTLTWNDSIIDNLRIFKCYWPMPYQRKVYSVDFHRKKFLANISGFKSSKKRNELYTERIKSIRFFESKCRLEFDLFGTGWDKSIFPSYRGEVESKQDVLSNYKFTLCYENMKNTDGYITEKIFDCFYANSIPVYWGASNILNYVPEVCFIDRTRFKNNEDLFHYLKGISEEEYNEKILAINHFLNSQHYELFLPKNYAKTLYSSVINFKNVEFSYFDAIVSIFYLIFFKTGLFLKNFLISILRK
jgi:hypothetical protein